MPNALNFRSHFHDCFSGESMNSRKYVTTGGVFGEYGMLLA